MGESLLAGGVCWGRDPLSSVALLPCPAPAKRGNGCSWEQRCTFQRRTSLPPEPQLKGIVTKLFCRQGFYLQANPDGSIQGTAEDTSSFSEWARQPWEKGGHGEHVPGPTAKGNHALGGMVGEGMGRGAAQVQ